MKIAVTGATGFVGRYIVSFLSSQGHQLRCWYRTTSQRDANHLENKQITWVPGELGDAENSHQLVQGCDAVVHAALYRPGRDFRGGEGDLIEFTEKNVIGTLRLIEAARQAHADRFVFISTCAVHEVILENRPLDEHHPLWPTSHYGAHKAALEKFVHSYGLGDDYAICALRPTGVYGVARPAESSKWFNLVQSVVSGEDVECRRGGKEVHAADVARAAGLLLEADAVAGQAYNCYDRYVSELEVATIAKQITGSKSKIDGGPMSPKHEIETDKLQAVGMKFGGSELLERTVGELVQLVNATR